MAKKIKVMVFGTFDGLHRGHRSLFRQAKKRGDYLIVIIGRNSTVRRLKGHWPIFDEKTRLRAVKSVKMINKVLLGDKKDYFKVVFKEKPDVICLGYDQKVPRKHLREEIKKRGLEIKICRLKPYRANIYKSSKLFRKNKNIDL